MNLNNPGLVKRLHDIYRVELKREFKQQKRTKEYVKELVEVRYRRRQYRYLKLFKSFKINDYLKLYSLKVLKLSPLRKENMLSKPHAKDYVKPQISQLQTS